MPRTTLLRRPPLPLVRLRLLSAGHKRTASPACAARAAARADKESSCLAMEDNYLLESDAVICNLSEDPSLFPRDCEGNILVAPGVRSERTSQMVSKK